MADNVQKEKKKRERENEGMKERGKKMQERTS